MERDLWDAIIVGGGPAGLTAALILGRCRRRVLLCDAGHPRNERAVAMHAFPTRDGFPPQEFLQIARKEIERYPSVHLWLDHSVATARRHERHFAVTLADGRTLLSRKLLLATGVTDELPKLEGIEEFYGRSVHHCPYCDGWETQDQPIAIYGRRQRAFEMARAMTVWSDDLVLCSDDHDRRLL